MQYFQMVQLELQSKYEKRLMIDAKKLELWVESPHRVIYLVHNGCGVFVSERTPNTTRPPHETLPAANTTALEKVAVSVQAAAKHKSSVNLGVPRVAFRARF
jgi:hypothetical protein